MSRLGDRRIFADMPFWRAATPDRRRRWAHAVEVAREIAESNRAAILAHPDLAGRVAELLKLPDVSRWNGYVPPELPIDERTWLHKYHETHPELYDEDPCPRPCKHDHCKAKRSARRIHRQIRLRNDVIALLDEARRRQAAS